MLNRVSLASVVLVLAASNVGCQALRTPLTAGRDVGELAARSMTEGGATLEGGFDTAVYSFDGKNRLTVLLYDGPIDDPRQAVTIRMFWRPRAGRTPLDGAATNATVNYVVFASDDRSSVGVYSGAGFLHPKSKLGKAQLAATLRNATLNLSDSDPTFVDLLGHAVLEGRFTARLDGTGLEQALRQLRVNVRNRLGRPRMVRSD